MLPSRLQSIVAAKARQLTALQQSLNVAIGSMHQNAKLERQLLCALCTWITLGTAFGCVFIGGCMYLRTFHHTGEAKACGGGMTLPIESVVSMGALVAAPSVATAVIVVLGTILCCYSLDDNLPDRVEPAEKGEYLGKAGGVVVACVLVSGLLLGFGGAVVWSVPLHVYSARLSSNLTALNASIQAYNGAWSLDSDFLCLPAGVAFDSAARRLLSVKVHTVLPPYCCGPAHQSCFRMFVVDLCAVVCPSRYQWRTQASAGFSCVPRQPSHSLQTTLLRHAVHHGPRQTCPPTRCTPLC